MPRSNQPGGPKSFSEMEKGVPRVYFERVPTETYRPNENNPSRAMGACLTEATDGSAMVPSECSDLKGTQGDTNPSLDRPEQHLDTNGQSKQDYEAPTMGPSPEGSFANPDPIEPGRLEQPT